MVDNLRRLSVQEVGKLTCFDGDASAINRQAITAPPDFCFIDGEHTRAAVLSDFEWCLDVCAADAAICFHDDNVIHPALETIMSRLHRQGISCTARKLSGVTFGIFLRNCPAARDPYILSHSSDGAWWLRGRRLWRVMPPWLRSSVRRVRRRATAR